MPGEQLFSSGGRTVRRILRQEGGVRVSCTYEINPDGAAEVLAKASDDLKTRIEGAEDEQKRKAAQDVLDYLVKNSAIDHVFSSGVDHPQNCFFGARRRRTRLRLAPVNRPSPRHRRETCSTALRFWTLGRTSLGPRVHWGHVRAEWATVNNYFGGFYNQAAKLFRYGDTTKDESIAWMDKCIDAEKRCLYVR